MLEFLCGPTGGLGLWAEQAGNWKCYKAAAAAGRAKLKNFRYNTNLQSIGENRVLLFIQWLNCKMRSGGAPLLSQSPSLPLPLEVGPLKSN